MTLRVVRHGDAAAFLRRAEPWLLTAEDRNNLLLGLAHEIAEDEPEAAEAERTPPAHDESSPYLATVEEDSDIVGVAFRAPPHQLLLSELPAPACAPLAEALAEAYTTLPAVMAPAPAAGAFARAWASLRGVATHPGEGQRLYRVDRVIPLRASGSVRVARSRDVRLVTAWVEAFADELAMSFRPGRALIAEWIERGWVHLWEDSGAPVAMAVTRGHTSRGVRIGYVYTPPERRRRGYAGALVSGVSSHMLAAGRDFCVLYAELSNTSTNVLYQRMGYRPVLDVVVVHFLPQESL